MLSSASHLLVQPALRYNCRQYKIHGLLTNARAIWLAANASSKPRLSRPRTLATTEDLSKDEIYERITEQLGPLSSASLIPKPSTSVIVISGPSGVGKDSVIRRLLKIRSDLHFVVTATSRKKRPLEVDGVDYHFVSKTEFEKWIEDDRMYEYALVYGEYKGVPKSQIENAFASGKSCLLRLDVQGAANVRKLHPNCITIYISPFSEEELVRRLVSRKTESLDNLLVRIRTAKQELECASEFDYVVLNKERKMDEAVKQICTILDAEKLRQRRRH